MTERNDTTGIRYDPDGTGPWLSGKRLDNLLNNAHGLNQRKKVYGPTPERDPNLKPRQRKKTPPTVFRDDRHELVPAKPRSTKRGTRGKKK